MGPGQARLVIRNQSTIAADEIPAIRKLLDQDLKSHGIQASGAESANTIRVTLSENMRERLWVAEVIEGSETHVTMVRVDAGALAVTATAKSGLVLRKQPVIETKHPLLAAAEIQDKIVAIEPGEIEVFTKLPNGWQEQESVAFGQKRAMARDPQGAIHTSAREDGFDAFAEGSECSGDLQLNEPSGASMIKCHESDDPWPIAQPSTRGGDSLKAFYNPAREYFTGVVTPSVSVDLPPFYSAALLPRFSGAGLLIGGIDGRVQMAENGALNTVSGTRDWGSDFAVLHSGCGAGDQVIASGSGEAMSDSLRAYEIPALEGVPASVPLAMDGTVMALASAPDGKSVMAVVRHASGEYEVDRVTALCD